MSLRRHIPETGCCRFMRSPKKTPIELDGFVEDWEESFEASSRALEFQVVLIGEGGGGSHDPADFDFRVWLGWMRSPARLYVAIQSVDDVHVSGFTGDDLHVDNIQNYNSIQIFSMRTIAGATMRLEEKEQAW